MERNRPFDPNNLSQEAQSKGNIDTLFDDLPDENTNIQQASVVSTQQNEQVFETNDGKTGSPCDATIEEIMRNW